MNAPLVDESIVRMSVNGTHTHVWRCSRSDLEALAIGRLYLEGIITTPDQAALIIEPRREDEVEIQARVTTPGPLRIARAGTLQIPPGDVFSELFRLLFGAVETRHEHGGMHAAAATDGAHIIAQTEDVGRHNTIDKITGLLVLQGHDPAGFGLLTSARVSGEIADKAARAGFAWLASRSIPTSLAVRFARDAHMPIIGRAAGKSAVVYR